MRFSVVLKVFRYIVYPARALLTFAVINACAAIPVIASDGNMRPGRTAEEVLSRYKEFTSVVTAGCGNRKQSSTEIIVCGTTRSRFRIESSALEPDQRQALVLGEVPRFSEAKPCPPRGCTEQMSLISNAKRFLDRLRGD